MPYLTSLFLFTMLIYGANSFQFVSDFSQEICKTSLQQGEFGEWKSALICGTKINSHSEAARQMKNLGLIHLIVVSGAHLSFFEHTLLTPLSRLLPLFLRAKMIFAGLVFYSFVAGLQAPLVRALFQKVLISGPLSVRIFISAGLSMVFFRDCSLSLLLSWACSLLITWPALSNPFGKSLFVLLGLYPLLLPLGAPELQSAMLQPLFSLFFGFFVFPATVLGVFLPIDHVVHGIWSGFFALLKHSHHFQFEMHFFRYQSFPSFFYVLLLQLLHWRSEIFAQRERLNH